MKLKLPTNLNVSNILTWIKLHKIISVIILIVVVGLTYFLWPKPPEPLETAKVKEGKIVQAIFASGKVESEQSVDLHFLNAGKVTYIGAKEGEEVKKGQVIAQLDQRTVQKNIESSLRDLAKQQNTYESTQYDNKDKPLTDPVQRVLESSQYDLEKALLSVELQELTREQSILTSPIDGILVHSDIKSTGVNASITSTFTVADPVNLIFEIEVDEADIGRVALQQPVNISLEAYPEEKIIRPVESIDFSSHKTDTGGTAYGVQTLLPDNSNFSYRIGMSGDAEIITSEKTRVLIIPIQSVEEEKFVYVKKEGTYEKRSIKLGIQSDTEVEVKDGLKAGEEIALLPEEAKKLVKSK